MASAKLITRYKFITDTFNHYAHEYSRCATKSLMYNVDIALIQKSISFGLGVLGKSSSRMKINNFIHRIVKSFLNY